MYKKKEDLISETNLQYRTHVSELVASSQRAAAIQGITLSLKNIEDFLSGINKWQKETFPNANAKSKLYHLLEEINETIADIDAGKEPEEEFADCFLLLYGAAYASGLDFEKIFELMSEKMKINRNRVWGQPDENGVVKHIEK